METWCGPFIAVSAFPNSTVVKSGWPKTLVADLPLSLPAVKVLLAVNGKYSTRLYLRSETKSPFVGEMATPYGWDIVEALGSVIFDVKFRWPSTRSACGSGPGFANGAGKRTTRPLPRSATYRLP